MKITFSFLLAAFAFGVACISPAHAAPSQLYGKSVVVSWSEEREQRVNGEQTTRNVARHGNFSVYLSSAGKPFSRMSFAYAGKRGGLKSGNRDAVGGEGSGNRKVAFSGNTMSVGMGMSGGARSILVTFDGGFGGCNAQVLTGKESGSSSIKAKSIVNGNDLEIISVKTGAASCSIRDGNVFGE